MNPFDLIKKGALGILKEGKEFFKDQNTGGIIKNTITGIPKAAVDLYAPFVKETTQAVAGTPKVVGAFLFPSRGYEKEFEQEARALSPRGMAESIKAGTPVPKLTTPTLTQTLKAPFQIAAELSSSLASAGSMIPGFDEFVAKRTVGNFNTPVAQKLADAGEFIINFGKPKNFQEAKAMRLVDIGTTLPMGTIKGGLKAAEIIAKSQDAVTITKTLVQEIPGLTEDAARALARPLTQINDINTVETVINRTKYALKGAKTPVFEGYTDLSTTVLEKLKGRSSVSKQFISDLTNSPELKQAEREAVRKILESYPDGDVPVKEFAEKVKAELLPLERSKSWQLPDGKSMGGKYENVTLPSEQRGNVANYSEHIYNSPIKTSAGGVHFSGGTNNYFGHTRVEDMRDGTRRVIEVQSDLYQKGRNIAGKGISVGDTVEIKGKPYQVIGDGSNMNADNKGFIRVKDPQYGTDFLVSEDKAKVLKSPLGAYSNPTAHFRMVREEIKQAAIDGKTKLQFPTGETAMKIEGLGQNNAWVVTGGSGFAHSALTPDKLKVGLGVSNVGHFQIGGIVGREDEWIITDVLGDGKFEAMPKEHFDSFAESKGVTGLSGQDLISYAEQHATKNFWGSKETFDISGKVDTDNPIYKFYEKELGRYLKSKHNAQLVTDRQGVSWWEVRVDKEAANKPVVAFNRKLDADTVGRNINTNETATKYGSAQPNSTGSRDLNRGSTRPDGVRNGAQPSTVSGPLTRANNSVSQGQQGASRLNELSRSLRSKIGPNYTRAQYARELIDAAEQLGLPKAAKNRFITSFNRMPSYIQDGFTGIFYPRTTDELNNASAAVYIGRDGWELMINPRFYGDNMYQSGSIIDHEIRWHIKDAFMKPDEQARTYDSINDLGRLDPNFLKEAITSGDGSNPKDFFRTYAAPIVEDITSRLADAYGPGKASELMEEITDFAFSDNVSENLKFFTHMKVDLFEKIQSKKLPISSRLNKFLNNNKSYIHNELAAKIVDHLAEGNQIPTKVKHLKIFEVAKDALGENPYKNSINVPLDEGVLFEKPNDIGRLIAEGKIRVRSKDGRDIYEYKKGNLWKMARDEDSAIKQVTPKQKPAVVLPEFLQKKVTEIEIKKEALENSPFKSSDNRLLVDKEGRVRELGDIKSPTLSRKVEDRIAESGVGDSKEFAKGVEDYLKQKKEVAQAEKSLKVEIKKMAVSDEGVRLAPNKRQREIIARSQGVQVSNTQQSKLPRQSKLGLPLSESELYRNRNASRKERKSSILTGAEAKSLEQLILERQQSAKIPWGEGPSTLPQMIDRPSTPVKQKVNTLDYIRTPEKVLKKIGLHNEFMLVRKGYDRYLNELPKNIEMITGWSKRVSKESNKKIFKYLDGQQIMLNKEELEVASEIRLWLEGWADRLGLPKDKRIANYITHLFDDQLIQKEFDEDLAKIIADKVPGSVYDPFLQQRLGAMGYIEDTWRALDAYVKRATRKVHMDPALEMLENASGKLEESQWDYVKNFADRLNMRPTKWDNLFDNLIKQVVGYRYGQRPVARLSQVLRRAVYRAMLGLNVGSALRNISQGANTYAKLGEKYTAIGYIKLFSPANHAELVAQNILNSGFVQDRQLSATKKLLEKTDKALFFLFEQAERINRGAAYFGAKSKALAEGKTEMQAIEYAKKIVRDTQFAFGAVDTPVGLNSDLLKIVSQFQTYTVKQTEFLAEMLKNKEYAGILRYTIGGLIFVYTIGQAFGMEPKELVPTLRLGVPPALKLPYEVGRAVLNAPDKFGQPRDLKEKATDIAKVTIGLIPSGSQLKKTYEGIKSIVQGGTFDKAGRMKFEQGQSTASKAQSILFGPYASKNADKYFNRAEITENKFKEIKPVYDQVKSLVAEGKKDEALEIVNGLSEAQAETFKKYKAALKTEATLQGKKDILPTYQQVQKLLGEEKREQALEIVNGLSDEQARYFKLVKDQVARDQKAAKGEKPEYEDGEPQTERSLLNTVITYGHAIGVDPVTAFNRIFSKQSIRYVTNGTIVVERLSVQESQAIKKEREGNNAEMKLDHTIPLQLGGSNNEDNLQLVTTEAWEAFTPVENALGKALRAGTISKREAQSRITRFKKGEITAEKALEGIN